MTDAKMYGDASFEIKVGRKYYHLEYGEVQPIAVVPGVVAGTVTEEGAPTGAIVLYEIINRAAGQNTTHADAAWHFDEQTSLMDEDGDGGGSSGGGGNGGSPLATEGDSEQQTPVEMTEQ